MQKVCTQFYTLNKKCIDSVELSSIPLCCKIPSRLVPQVSKGPYYGNLFFLRKKCENRKNGNKFTAGWANSAFLEIAGSRVHFGSIGVPSGEFEDPKTRRCKNHMNFIANPEDQQL